MKKIFTRILLLVLFTISLYSYNLSENIIAASTEYVGEVQLGGDSIGLKIDTNVEIVGTYEVITSDGKQKPWENSDIKKGDFIYSVNDILIKNNSELNSIVKNNKSSFNLIYINRDRISFVPVSFVIRKKKNG